MPDETNVKIFLNSFPFGELEKTTRSLWKIKTVQQDLKSNNFSLNDAVELAQNCPLWRLMHSYCCTSEKKEERKLRDINE